MPWDPELVESAAPQAWTGKPGALVYEQASQVSAWLAARGYGIFPALSEQQQQQSLLRATEAIETEARRYVKHRLVKADAQKLIFPGLWAYDALGRLCSTAPESYLDAIRMACEEMAGGTWMADAPPPNVLSEGGRLGSIYYADRPPTVERLHQEIWKKMRAGFPWRKFI